jgi:TolB protein
MGGPLFDILKGAPIPLGPRPDPCAFIQSPSSPRSPVNRFEAIFRLRPLFLWMPALLFSACGEAAPPEGSSGGLGPGPDFVIGAGRPVDDNPLEPRLRNVRQLTFGGENAEGYFSFDGTKLVFQSSPRDGNGCDQIYVMDLATGETELVSTGMGRTTCSYFFPGDDRILFSSTHHHDPFCPARPSMAEGYVWPLYRSYDIFSANLDGTGLVQLTDTDAYDAEATISPRGDRIIFTSTRDGDLELYSMALDGTDVRRLTHTPGYDGGAFYSPDGSRIGFRAHYPESEAELADYRRLLEQDLIRPSRVDLYVMNEDGSGKVRLTDNGAANFAPFWHPSGNRLLFSSNLLDPRGRHFELFLINDDGTGQERVTFHDDFDGFPMFSPDGRFLVWASNRFQEFPGETNLFIAEWVETLPDGSAR